VPGGRPEFCGNCGARLEPEDFYCLRCGQRIEDLTLAPVRRARKSVVWVAALTGVCTIVGIGLAAGGALLWGTGQIPGPDPLRPSTASTRARVTPTATLVDRLSPSPTPLASSTRTPMAAHTATPTSIPQATSTASPTGTHTSTPVPTQTAKPSPTPSCGLAAGPTFVPLWVGAVRSQIGCPTSTEHGVNTAYQEFEGGFMVWRSDRDLIVYVFYKDGTYAEFTPTWQDGMPEYGCPDPSTPSTSPPTPRRGFGSVWCNYPEVRERLGWARADEVGDYRNLQDFQRGWMLQRAVRADAPRYVAYSDTHTWEQH